MASECRDLRKAEKWRMQIIREIAKKVAQIQNAGLGEFRIRDLNDEINKLLREKRHWEAQIKELGGPDYSRVGPRMLDHEGREVKSQIITTVLKLMHPFSAKSLYLQTNETKIYQRTLRTIERTLQRLRRVEVV